MSRLYLLGASLLALLTAPHPWAAEAPESLVALELPEAQLLAVQRQPLLQAREAAVRAARETAVAAAQLPDPRLKGGVSDLTLTGADRFTLQNESDTQFMVSVMQEIPREDKRRLLGERASREAEMAEQLLTTARWQTQRNAGLAWLEAWKAEQAAQLVRASEHEADLQLQAVEIAYSTGRATQADVLAARVALELVRDEVAGLRQQAAHARNALSRWIGPEAQRPLCPDLPEWGAPPELAVVIERLHSHPHVNAEGKRVEMAAAEVALARQAYSPDWSVELGYGYRPSFADYVNLQFSMDLPYFTGRRQDRALGAKLAEQEQAEQLRDDHLREEMAQARLDSEDWRLLQERLKRYDDDILPQAERRTAAALAAWQAGQGTLTTVLDARRMALDNRLRRLALETDAAMHRINLQYFAGEQP